MELNKIIQDMCSNNYIPRDMQCNGPIVSQKTIWKIKKSVTIITWNRILNPLIMETHSAESEGIQIQRGLFVLQEGQIMALSDT